MINFIQNNINFLNDIQSYHWQTESYSEHESLGEYYTNFNKLNDEFVETLQGKTNERIKFIANRGISMSNTIIGENISNVKCKLGGNIAKKSCLLKSHRFVFDKCQ